VVTTFVKNANPGDDMVSDTGAGNDIQGCSEDMRYIWYVRSCCVNSSINSDHALHVYSISSDQNVYSMSQSLEMGYIQSKEFNEGGDFISISGDTRASYDLCVPRYTSHQSQTIVSLSLQQRSHAVIKRELSEHRNKRA
jgi:hypothetical protein